MQYNTWLRCGYRLDYFNARWYDAETGRFISEDPMGDPNNPNFYSYCWNNPLNVTDPTGLETMTTGNGGTYDTETGTYTPPPAEDSSKFDAPSEAPAYEYGPYTHNLYGRV